ncbi:MAG: hypothetical protein EA404_02960 [Spirochaetaceae bacterium]|nr:MAG: hypothetical protein EA404_02960 [Spirochaetaceae bacterium]
MRVLRIALTNLNSLRGSHVIELARQPLAGAGLFAITGPTGAGKSTILDAVTLALYGRAARYGNRPSPEDVMSRHCGECNAEVEFAVSAGVFRATWQLRRARGKPDGALQPAQRYVYNAAGVPLTQKIQECEQKIEELIGLDYDRFLRSVLLAQGEFARFLKARPAERAELLESLTGTAIYSELGRLVHHQLRARKMALQQQQQLLQQLEVLDEEARSETERQIEALSAAYRSVKQELQAAGDMRARVVRLQEVIQRRTTWAAQQAEVEAERARRADELSRLERHRRLHPYLEPLARLEAAERERNNLCEQLSADQEEALHARQQLNHATEILHRGLSSALQRTQEQTDDARGMLEVARGALAAEQAWLEDHQRDAAIADRYAELVTALTEVRAARAALAEQWQTAHQRAQDLCDQPLQECAPSEALLAQLPLRAERAVEAIRRERDSAEETLKGIQQRLRNARLVADLAVYRNELLPGRPCPLCGATDHRITETAVADSELAELSTEADMAEAQATTLRSRLEHAMVDLQQLQRDCEKVSHKLHDCRASEAQLAAQLEAFAIALPPPTQEQALLQELKQRADSYRGHLAELNSALQAIVGAEHRLADGEQAIRELDAKRRGLPPVSAEAVRKQQGKELDVGQAEEDYQRKQRSADSAQAVLASRIRDERAARERLDRRQSELESLLADTDIAGVEQLRKARLSQTEEQQLQELKQELEARAGEAATLLRSAEEEIEELRDNQTLEGAEAERFLREHESMQQRAEQILRELTTLQNRIERDDRDRAILQRKRTELEQKQQQLKAWALLDELIGSHDGARFRTIAQSISLDLLMRHANRHLAQLSDRYRIVGNQSNQLGLDIEDLHQASVRRPMQSLSGGESFLASLALALGLSDLAGRTVRIDTLFIDEGFGSLDAGSLDIAISALESLQQRQKTVGVISHVALLKERIAAQIVVEKLSGGVSRILTSPS